MIRNYKYRIGEHSITFKTGESHLGRWYGRKNEQSHFRMKIWGGEASKINPKPTQHCICSWVLLTSNLIMLIPPGSLYEYKQGSLPHVTRCKWMLFYHRQRRELTNTKGCRIKGGREEAPWPDALRIPIFVMQRIYWQAMERWEEDRKKPEK